ncbi:MAG: TonB-dependent receptor, plug [Rariglobus sp.]|jgi:iron complex outermembrane receptor protein|nr:TonB-dependent receptor, plug [Rariglobus sp.]
MEQPSAIPAPLSKTRLRKSPPQWFTTARRTSLGICLVALISSPAFAQTEVTTYKKLSLQELMDLEVSSVSRRSEKLSETASAIQVVTGEDIRRSGATSIPEALRLAPNLFVAQIDSRQWAVSARGFNSTTSNKLLVMIDGRTVYTPLFAGVFWDVQDTLLEDIDRIEVISGPGATLWGANAVNGVINITTREARDTQGLLLLGGAGTELLGFGGLRYGGALSPTLHYRIYTKYFERDSTLLASTGDEADNRWNMGQTGFRLDWNPAEDNLFTVQGDLYGGRIDQAGPDDIEVSGGNLLGRWTHRFTPDSDLQLQWYYDRTHRDIPGTFRENLATYDFDLQHHFVAGERHNLIWGVGYRLVDDHVANGATLAFLPADVTREWFSVFLQDEIALVPDRLSFTLGTKLEKNDYTGWEVQPSVRLAWRPTSTQTVWSAVSRAMRTPSRIDRELFAPGTPPFTVLQGGPDFESEELIAYELGYRVQVSPRLSLSAAAFYHDYDDLRSLEQAAPPAPTPLVIGNGLEGESYGVELTADYHVTDTWRIQAGYTRLFVDLRPKPGSTDVSGGSNESHDASNQFSLRSSLDLPWNLEFDVTLRHVGEISNQDVPSYQEADVRIGWRPKPQLELSVVGQNLLHDHHAEFGSPASRQEIQRGVYAKATWLY